MSNHGTKLSRNTLLLWSLLTVSAVLACKNELSGTIAPLMPGQPNEVANAAGGTGSGEAPSGSAGTMGDTVAGGGSDGLPTTIGLDPNAGAGSADSVGAGGGSGGSSGL